MYLTEPPPTAIIDGQLRLQVGSLVSGMGTVSDINSCLLFDHFSLARLPFQATGEEGELSPDT